MRILDIEEVRSDLENLVDKAAEGESFLISIDGKSMVRVERLDAPEVEMQPGILGG